MLKDEIEINQFKKKTHKNKSQPTLTFEISNYGNEPKTNLIESKS
jgi:hypothetical protein